MRSPRRRVPSLASVDVLLHRVRRDIRNEAVLEMVAERGKKTVLRRLQVLRRQPRLFFDRLELVRHGLDGRLSLDRPSVLQKEIDCLGDRCPVFPQPGKSRQHLMACDCVDVREHQRIL